MIRKPCYTKVFFLSLAFVFICIHSVANPGISTSDTSDSENLTHRIASVILIGNKLTRDHIIYRELTFRIGDTLKMDEGTVLFKRSEENLLNTSLFNSVKITWITDTLDQSINVYIIMTERWYVFPLPIFEIAERNFNVWWETKDFSRVVYGGVLYWNNFRGRNESLAATLRLGYTQRVSLFYEIPFIDKKQKAGLTFGFAYSRNRQSSFATQNDKVQYFKDEKEYAKRETGLSVAYVFRPDLYETHGIEANFRSAEVLDTILKLNPEYFAGKKSSQQYFSFRYFYKLDHRDLVVYPLRGYYFDVEFVKNGIRLLNDDINLMYVSSRYRQFWDIGRNFYFSSGLSGKYSSNEFQPYYNTRALGYGREYLRGYEFYVLDGQRYALLKTNLKYALLKTRELKADFIPLPKFNVIPYAFYLNLYFDAGYVKDTQFQQMNNLVNKWQYSGGIGIDFVTYYDMVFRLEHSLNKLGESGFFLHFTAPI